jgi:hypothetical protein
MAISYSAALKVASAALAAVGYRAKMKNGGVQISEVQRFSSLMWRTGVTRMRRSRAIMCSGRAD